VTTHHYPQAHPLPIFGELGYRSRPPLSPTSTAPADSTSADAPVYSDPTATPDPTDFSVGHPSDNSTYAQIGELLKKQVVDVPASRAADGDLYPLETVFGQNGAAVTAAIRQAGKIVFHAVGDTGASDVRKYKGELRAADQMSLDARTSDTADQPKFFFHLGDVVYNFGEAAYYYDQFYEPYRAYPGPIIAIPGNHDSFVVPGTPAGQEPLTTFQRQFDNPDIVVTAEAGSLHRTATTAPGVYFALDAPFVRIIGLFSNALEDPGVISSESGRWNISDRQLAFLAAQLARVKTEGYKGAVVLAVHHPPFTYATPPRTGSLTGNHGSSTDMLRDIDTVCAAAGIYPHAVFSAHAHNYQRYTRTINLAGNMIEVPFVVCGSGGHNINPLVRGSKQNPAPEPGFGTDVSYLEVRPAVQTTGLVLERYDDVNYGYLRVTATPATLEIAFHQVSSQGLAQSRYDLVTIDLAQHRLAANSSAVARDALTR